MMVQFHQGGFTYIFKPPKVGGSDYKFSSTINRVAMGSLGIEPLLKDHESF